MKLRPNTCIQVFAAAFAATLLALPSFGQEKTEPPVSAVTAPVSAADAKPNDAEMMKQMMEMSKLNENHKLLGSLAGTWSYTVKFWMGSDLNAPPTESKGVAVRKPVMDGRYYSLDVTGKMKMPGPDGKPKDFTFKGMGLEGYDNVKKKFVGTWVDNMGTGVMMSEGSYDPGTNSVTYTSEIEMMPGVKTKVRSVVKITDKDHHVFEWYENRGGKEVRSMEISYTRKK